MGAPRKLLPPVTAGDVGLFCFFMAFVVVGIGVFATVSASDGLDPFIVLWTAMFVGIPLVMMHVAFARFRKLAVARRRGTGLKAKVVGHVSDPSMTVNGRPVDDLKVRFVGEDGAVREAEVDANLMGRSKYPVGSTVDVYEHDGEYILGSRGYDEELPREDELMRPAPGDSAPSAPAGTVHTATCPCCGRLLAIDDRWRLQEILPD